MPTSPPLPPFAHPVHFVCPDEMLWPELRDGFRSLSDETISRRCLDGTDCWIVRPWYELRKRGLDATISARPRSDAMNIASNRLTGRKFRALHPNAFLIIPREDGHVPKLANFGVRQNGVPSGSQEFHIRMFGQPGLRPRNPDRGTRVETMHFKGDPVNLSKRFLTDDFISRLTALGVELVHGANTDMARKGDFWADYTTCDLILAARNLTVPDALNKPTSKLVNSWEGGVPPLLGPEPAFFDADPDMRGWICVQTPDDVIAAVTRLKENPAEYEAIIDYGRGRAHESSAEAICALWIEMLNGPAADAFEDWKVTSLATKISTATRALLEEPKSRATYTANINMGNRILDTPLSKLYPQISIPEMMARSGTEVH